MRCRAPASHHPPGETRTAGNNRGRRRGVLYDLHDAATDFLGQKPRFQQLVDWLGEDFEGVIAFDEAHLMKDTAVTPHGGKATVDQGTLRGNMGIALQRHFPLARVRYFSATGATEARHIAPYERLGLWGPGAPFPDFAVSAAGRCSGTLH